VPNNEAAWLVAKHEPPPPRVIGHGLGAIQTACDIQRRGVSAAKVVVDLD
jgi:hypothetical protein